MTSKISEQAEEVLELIWEAMEEAAEPEGGEHPGRVELREAGEHAQQLGELEGNRLIELDGPSRVGFTDAGRLAAAGIIRRHRLGERLVRDVLDIDGEVLEDFACRFEHMVHQGLEESICTLLGHPKVCPHGRPIPTGECCRQARQEVGRLVQPLTDLQVGQSGTIAYLHAEDQARLGKLMAMGVLPGTHVELRRRTPTYVFSVGFSQFAVDEEVAGSVFVRVEPA